MASKDGTSPIGSQALTWMWMVEAMFERSFSLTHAVIIKFKRTTQVAEREAALEDIKKNGE
jgi:hypothetical protein